MNEGSYGSIALVTGAAGSVGEAVSIALSESGYKVIMADIDIEKISTDKKKIPNSFSIRMDVGNPSEVEHTVREILTSYGPIDVLVNCAGILATGSIAEADYFDWDLICRTNLSSVFYCSKAIMSSMVECRRGRIINISSTSAVRAGGFLGNALYGTTKAGVEALTKGFAREMGSYGVTVNAVSPGLLESPMTFHHLTPSRRNDAISSIPVRRLGLPQDIANAVMFLASDQASFINGAIITVDGGGVIA